MSFDFFEKDLLIDRGRVFQLRLWNNVIKGTAVYEAAQEKELVRVKAFKLDATLPQIADSNKITVI